MPTKCAHFSRFFGLFTLAVFCLFLSTAKAQARAGEFSSITLDASTGIVLQANEADTPRYPASLTKLMTLYMLFDALEKGWITPETPLPVTRRAARQPASKLWLPAGGSISVENAIMAMITKSANDVAAAVAEALGGTERNFALMMTRVAHELGMRDTVFKNASGLYHREQLTTARDMAVLSMALITHFPQYYPLFSTRKFSFNDNDYYNHNRLMRKYNGVDGLKTGYIGASGFNLVASAQKGERRLIGVVMGRTSQKDRDKRMTGLLDAGFRKLILSAENIPLPTEKPQTTLAMASETKEVGGWLRPKKTFAAYKPQIDSDFTSPLTLADLKDSPLTDRFEKLQDSWGVQVGAFLNYIAAQQTAVLAKDNLLGTQQKPTVQISPHDPGTGMIYRARLLGLSEKEAHGACRQLLGKKLSCIVLPPNKPQKVAQLAQ